MSVRLIVLGATPAASSHPACSFRSAPSSSRQFVCTRPAQRACRDTSYLVIAFIHLYSLLLLSLSTPATTSSRTYRKHQEGVLPVGNPPEGNFELFTSLLAQLAPGLFTALSRPPPRPIPLALQRSTPRTAKGRVKATRRDATFVAAKPDQGPKPLTSL